MTVIRDKFHWLLVLALLVSCTKENNVGSEQAQKLVKYFGGSATDKAMDVKLCSDGGYALTGTLVYNNVSQAFFIKTDQYGNALSSSPQYISNGNISCGNSICQTKDGSFLIVGFTQTASQAKDILLAKVTAEGLLAWTRPYGGVNNEEGYSVSETSSGNILITGYTESKGVGGKDAWCLLLDKDGNKIWDRSFGFAGDDNGVSFVEETGYFLLVGYTVGTGIFMTKVEKTSGVPSEFGYYATGSFLVTESVRDDQGNIYVLANIGPSTASNMYLLKLNYKSSTVVWSKTLASDKSESGHSIALNNNKLVLAGSSTSTGQEEKDFLVDIIDTAGQLLNGGANTIPAQGDQEANACVVGTDGKVVLAGSNVVNGFSKIVLVKKD